MSLLTIILIIISFFIIIISFLMSPDSNGFSGALVGSGDLDLFKVSKERGVKKVLKYSMMIFGFILLGGSLILRVFL
ncbi:preprotein translocase, SecG subunit [Mycoplasmopsis canis UFG4]|uniref:Protein-export membrane protein SecG n=2 Tax=Mycoplasmopsis canis TaxID=29555 RepID=I1A6W5_9BACT|nr:preprotein translocase subunit SecG [Mycoplasmopsis canis]AKF41131.1 preprotein translocase subunit SecG [Mycoplasmopsis canis]AMD81244.1 preprotein translocase subunit SecG [Mycoplasmopsis canis PG 14]EIE40477.1 preprotein translocase, SecG subunit [Mycoplasmopsis canis UF31]EIE40617.1 preprotein translocase, SecG subunit [Mycoplasmopsis canis PG 14]EIE40760.1 preprotein translocase, SecG subunit [Mycoplasmopsis canis UF33]